MEIDHTVATMTTKEVAEALGVSRQTVSRVAKKLFPECVKNGKALRCNQEMAYAIARDINVSRPSQPSNRSAKVAQVDYEKLAVTIARAVAIALRETMPGQEPKQTLLAPPEISDRDGYRRAINAAAHRTGLSQQELYGMVAGELYYRCHVNIRVKAKNAGVSMIDIIEQEGLFQDAISIAAGM